MKIQFTTQQEFLEAISSMLEYRIINKNDQYHAQVTMLLSINENLHIFKTFHYLSINKVSKIFNKSIKELWDSKSEEHDRYKEILVEHTSRRLTMLIQECIKQAYHRPIPYDLVDTKEKDGMIEYSEGSYYIYLDEEQCKKILLFHL